MSEAASVGKVERIPELDGIRGMAIAMVLFFHYFGLTVEARPGSALAYVFAITRLSWTGVDLFFVLSGFLIGGILLDERSATNYFQIFYKRRFFRIVPIYSAILLVFFAASLAGPLIKHGDFSWLSGPKPPWYTYWLFMQNFWMAKLGTLGSDGLGMTWSLVVEEQFYLTLPLLIRLVPSRWLLKGVVAGIFAAPILRIALRLIWPHNWTADYVLMPCRADALLAGLLVAIVLRNEKWKARVQRSGVFPILLPVLAIGLLVLTVKSRSLDTVLMGTVGYSWIALSYATLLLYSLIRKESVVSQMFRIRWLGWLGGIAYGTYLLHQPVQILLFGYLWGHAPLITSGTTLLGTILALLLTLVIARVSWKYFESPLIRVGHRSGYEYAGAMGNKVPQSATGMVSL